MTARPGPAAVGPAPEPLPETVHAAAPRGVAIRHVRTHDEFVACVELQTLTWGAAFRELVPATILKITQRVGGVTAGAFAADGTLLGFVFGITGVEHGLVVHWSDMLAVRPEAQGLGIGRQLKLFQREAVRALGAAHMYWTYDPLVARNAYFNLERLGARVHEYVPDMYGADTGSTLHSGLGTDRFVVRWPIDRSASDGADGRAGAAVLDALDAPVLNPGGRADGAPGAIAGAAGAPLVRIAVPGDIFGVLARAADQAAAWRQGTRAAFQWALAHGYHVAGFAPGPRDGHGHYLLARDPGAPTALHVTTPGAIP